MWGIKNALRFFYLCAAGPFREVFEGKKRNGFPKMMVKVKKWRKYKFLHMYKTIKGI